MGRKQKLREERTKQRAEAQAGQAAGGGGMPAERGLGRMVVLGIAVGLAAMLVWTVVWRAENPSLVEKPRQRPASSQADMGQGGGQNMEMITALMQRLKDDPNDVHTLHTLAEQFMRMQAWDRAEALLERAVVVEPTNQSVLNLMGIVEFNLGRHRDAADKFELLLELDPANLMARYNLGVLYGHFLEDKAKGRTYFQSVMDAPEASADMKSEAAEAMKSLD